MSRDSDISVPPFRPAVAAKDPATMSRPPLQPATPPASAMPQGGARPVTPPATRPADTTESDRRTLVVGRGISVQGTVTDCERLVVVGTVDSTLIQATEIEVAIGGMFKGGVEVEDAVIAGTIDGTVTARGSLVVKSTGRVIGTAHCRRLQVEDGGQITGQIQMMTGQSTSDLPPRPAMDAAS
jgi:cytoskeletal protein CcmA (bactofilin family)